MNEVIRWQLINATVNGDSQRLRSLLSNRVRLDHVQACQLFHLAATCGCTDILNTLLAFKPSINVNSRDEVGCTALHKAASAGHREIIHFLIYHGGQIDVQEFLHGNSALHEAASKGFSRSVEALCILRASPNLQNKLGLTALHVAAQHGHRQSIRVLLSSGADIGATDSLGNTCLHKAVAYGRANVVKILLSASANIMTKNCNLDTPLHIAASLKHTKIARCLLNAIVRRGSGMGPGGGSRRRMSSSIQPLSVEQAVLSMRNAQGETPLEVAKRRIRNDEGGGSKMVTLILDRMSDAESYTKIENAFSKLTDRFTDSSKAKGSEAALATPYMSTDLIYPSVHVKTGFKLTFKNRKLSKNGTPGRYDDNGLLNRQVRQELRPSNLIPTPSNSSKVQPLQINAAPKITSSSASATTTANPVCLPDVVKTKSRTFRRHLLGGFFKRENGKTDTPKMPRSMKKSESSQLHQPEVFQLPVSTKLLPSTSLPGALNESPSATLAESSIPQDASLSVDDPLQSSLLFSRFQQLPFPQDSENTSAGVNSVQLLEDATPSSLSDCDRSSPHSFIRLRSQPVVCSQSSNGAGDGSSGSGERVRPRLGVRFDLASCGEARISSTSVHNGQQVPKQSQRDLSSIYKKNPSGSKNARPDCIDTIDGQQWMRPCSDQSGSLSKPVVVEPLINASSVAATIAATETSTSAAVLHDTSIQTPNGQPVFSKYKNASERPQNGYKVQPTLAHKEVSHKLNLRQNMSKSKSYNCQMATSVAANVTHMANGGPFNWTMARQVVGKSPLYMSCHNIDGKMGLSVGHLSPPIPSNGA